MHSKTLFQRMKHRPGERTRWLRIPELSSQQPHGELTSASAVLGVGVSHTVLFSAHTHGVYIIKKIKISTKKWRIKLNTPKQSKIKHRIGEDGS